MLEGGVCNMNRPAACVSAVIGHVSCCLHDPACHYLAAWHIPTIKGQLDAVVRHLLGLNAWLVDWHCHLDVQTAQLSVATYPLAVALA